MSRADDHAVMERDGFVVQRGLLEPSEVEALRVIIGNLEQEGAPRSRQILYTRRPPPSDRPGMDRLMDQWLYPWTRVESGAAQRVLARLAGCLSYLTGHAMVPFQDVALVKRPGHDAFPWHQDLPFWPVDGRNGAVTWLALDGVGAENGGLELSPGSHRSGVGPPIDLHTGEAQDGYPCAEGPPSAGQILSLEAGDGILFHAGCWHRSGVNVSGRPRRAWSISWLPRAARWTFGEVPRHPIRGQVTEGEEVSRWSESRYRLPPV